MVKTMNRSIKYENYNLENSIYYNKENYDPLSYPEDARKILFDIEDKSYWFQHRNNIILSCMKKIPPENNIIFDVGGGNGNISAFLQKNGYMPIMFEPGKNGVINANLRGVKNIFCSFFSKENIICNSCESVGLFDVIEHVEDDLKFLEEIYELVKPNGKIYITVPAHKFLWSSEDEKDHYRRYNKKNLKDVVSKAGFKILYCSYFFYFLPVPIFIARSLPYKLFGNKNTKELKKEEFVTSEKFNSIIHKLLLPEIKRVDSLKEGFWGSSLILVAEKLNQHTKYLYYRIVKNKLGYLTPTRDFNYVTDTANVFIAINTAKGKTIGQ